MYEDGYTGAVYYLFNYEEPGLFFSFFFLCSILLARFFCYFPVTLVYVVYFFGG